MAPFRALPVYGAEHIVATMIGMMSHRAGNPLIPSGLSGLLQYQG